MTNKYLKISIFNNVIKILALITLSSLLTSCKGGECVYGHDFGDVSISELRLEATNEDPFILESYTDVNLTLTRGGVENFNVEFTGSDISATVFILFYNGDMASSTISSFSYSDGLSRNDSIPPPDDEVNVMMLVSTSLANAGTPIKVTVDTLGVDSNNFSGFIDNAVNPVKDFLFGERDAITGSRDGGIVKVMFEGITYNGKFIAAIRALLALMIVIAGLSYLLGVMNFDINEMVFLSFRIGIIIILISPSSWEFFYKYLLINFVDTIDWLIWVMSRQFTEAVTQGFMASNVDLVNELEVTNVDEARSETFRFIGQTINVFFSETTSYKLQGMFFSRWIGFIYIIVIYISVFIFLLAVGKAIIIYLTTIVIVAMLMVSAPIFISCIMFGLTRGMFRSWFNQLLSFSIQPVLLFMVLTIFNAFVISTFYNLTMYTVCWGCVWPIKMGKLGWYCMMDAYSISPSEVNNGELKSSQGSSPDYKMSQDPIGIFLIFIFYAMVNLFYKLTSWSTKMAGFLTSGGDTIDSMAIADKAVSDFGSGDKVDRKTAQKQADVGSAGDDDNSDTDVSDRVDR